MKTLREMMDLIESAQQGVAEGSESQDKLVSMLNSFDYYSDNSKVYVNDAGDKIARQGSNWKHQSGKVGNGPEELGNFLSSNQGVAEGSDWDEYTGAVSWPDNDDYEPYGGEHDEDELDESNGTESLKKIDELYRD